MPATALALSRTCNLGDFPGALSVANWQERLAHAAWERWVADYHVRTRKQSLVVNYSGCAFQAPGPSAIYRYRGLAEDIERTVSAIYALTVVDKVEAPVRFLTRSAQLLRPRGLLLLTFAFWDAEGEDVAAGHEERERIYDATSWKKLIAEARRAGFQTFGGVDWRYHGDLLSDHSLGSLVLTRR